MRHPISSALCLPSYGRQSLLSKTRFVFRTTVFVFRTTKTVADDKVCRGRQSLSLATQLVFLDGPRLYRLSLSTSCTEIPSPYFSAFSLARNILWFLTILFSLSAFSCTCLKQMMTRVSGPKESPRVK